MFLDVENKGTKDKKNEQVLSADQVELSKSRVIGIVDNVLSAAQDQGLLLEIQGHCCLISHAH
jgi:hypothetical protein